MRGIVAAVSIVLMGISTPVLAQNSAPASPAGASAVNYDNGMQALGQAPSNDDNNQGIGGLFGGSGGGMGTVGAVLLGGAAIGGIAFAISQSSSSSPTSP